MANSRTEMHLYVGHGSNVRGAGAYGGTRQVEATVIALVPEYHQVKVRDAGGHIYALTRKTDGIDLGSLHEGQRIVCTVTRKLPRVLTATTVTEIA